MALKALRNCGLIAVLGLVLAVTACKPTPANGPSFHSVDITGARYAHELALPDTQGKPRQLSDFAGKVVVVFFGYTQCPDVCPTTMSELAQAKRELGARGALVQGVFVTLDPERDTADILGRYVQAFDPSFIALRGSLDQTRQAAQEFHVFFEKVPGSQPGSYSIDHTAGAFVFDQAGHVRLFSRYGMGAKLFAEDLGALLAEKR